MYDIIMQIYANCYQNKGSPPFRIGKFSRFD